MPVIDSSDVVKRYGRKTVLSGFSFQVDAGDVCALAGPNGAGKTTFLRLALGLARPTGGTLKVLGVDPGLARRRINYLSEDEAIYPHLSAADNIRVSVLARGEPAPTKDAIYTILDSVALSHAGRQSAGKFSLGMKRRLQLAMTSLVHKADLYILDEPTNGLDINGLLWFKRLLSDLKGRGACVLIATHALDVLEDAVTSFAVLRDGRVVSRQAVSARQALPSEIHVTVAAADVERLRRVFPQAAMSGTSASITGVTLAELYRLLALNEIIPLGIDSIRHSLSQVYLDAIEGV
ncbi:MAG: ABC transporter ATP-binding protein [Propionibacteriaceae bacterium]|nr:ABC transporter ATP-binding protein [Propionibacteriaceae bacterium]